MYTIQVILIDTIQVVYTIHYTGINNIHYNGSVHYTGNAHITETTCYRRYLIKRLFGIPVI